MAQLTPKEELVLKALLTDLKSKGLSADRLLQTQFFKSLPVDKQEYVLKTYASDILKDIRIDKKDWAPLTKKALPSLLSLGLTGASVYGSAQAKSMPLKAALLAMPAAWWLTQGTKGLGVVSNIKDTVNNLKEKPKSRESFSTIAKDPSSERSENLILKKVLKNAGL